MRNCETGCFVLNHSHGIRPLEQESHELFVGMAFSQQRFELGPSECKSAVTAVLTRSHIARCVVFFTVPVARRSTSVPTSWCAACTRDQPCTFVIPYLGHGSAK